MRGSEEQSSNWAGYAVSGGPFREISASWEVPTVQPDPSGSRSAIFIGVDGNDNGSLLQVGTEQDYQSGGQYYAWWEMLPAPESQIATVPISPGDHISASLREGLNGQWTISISDTTTGRSFSTIQSYSAPKNSAEWILEAPKVGGQDTTLANIGQVTFSDLTLDGAPPALSEKDRIVMARNDQDLAVPSSLTPSGFSITYE